MAKKKSTGKQLGRVAKKATKKKPAAPKATKASQKTNLRAAVKKKAAKKKSNNVRSASIANVRRPANMSSNEPLVGQGKRDEPVPAIAKRVKTKTAAVGKRQRVKVPVRTGTAGGRPGGGGTGELSPVRDTAAGRGYGQKRTQR